MKKKEEEAHRVEDKLRLFVNKEQVCERCGECCSAYVIQLTQKDLDTWLWEIKDTDSRTVPLTEDVIRLLINLQERRPAHYPYVFVPPKRYDRIQAIRNGHSKRNERTWTAKDANNSVINNFSDMFNEIRTRAGIKK